MKDTTQLIADLRRYDSGEAVCELYDGGLHESAAACIEELQSQLAQYENCTAGNLLKDNLRMANEMTVLEREVARLRNALEAIATRKVVLFRFDEGNIYRAWITSGVRGEEIGDTPLAAIEAAMKEESK